MQRDEQLDKGESAQDGQNHRLSVGISHASEV